MTPYLSRKIRIISFISLILVFLQHAINFTGYIDPDSSFASMRSWNGYIQYFLGYGVTRFAVPLFFVLSGYLFYRNFSFGELWRKYRSRFRSLLTPYILWNILAILGIVVLQSIPSISHYFSSFYTGSIVAKNPGSYASMILNHGVSFHLWFVRDLMVYTICAPIIFLFVRLTSFVGLIPLFLCWFLRVHIPVPFVYWDSAGVFYLIGVWLALYGKGHRGMHGRSMTWGITGIWIALVFYKTVCAFGFATPVFMTLAKLDNVTILFGMTAVWMLYDLSSGLQTRDIWMRLSAYTFFVYAFHEPLLDLLKYTLVGWFRIHMWSTLPLYFLIPCMCLAICYSVAFACKKLLPSVYLILSGGR